jgi:hypothetical protein
LGLLGSEYYQNKERSETNPLPTGIRPKKRKPMIPKLSRIKHTAFLLILSDLSTDNNTISLDFQREKP